MRHSERATASPQGPLPGGDSARSVGAHGELPVRPLGNVTRETDRKNQVTTFLYDALSRRILTTYQDASTTAYTYDKGNRLRRVLDSLGGTDSLAYDDLDRLTQETSSRGTVSYTYDNAGRRISLSVTGQPAVIYGYDNADRLTQITQGSSSVSFAYDEVGRDTTLTLPNGINVKYSYDKSGRITSIAYTKGGTLGDLSYTYDAAGRQANVGGSWARTGLPATTTASYDAANQQVAFNGATLTYDANGALTGDGTNTYGWNAREQLSSILGPLTTATFQYDGLGRRSQKAINGTVTDFLYDGLNAVQELSGGTPAVNILTGLGIDEVFSRTDATVTANLLPDPLGSIVALSNGAGSITTEYTYEPFGTGLAVGAPSTNPVQYTARENDETGLYYYRARYYSPRLSRFVSEDLVELGSWWPSWNLYVYADNNPVNSVDPLGLYTLAPGAPPPSAELDALLKCIEAATGISLFITATTNGVHTGSAHGRGVAADVLYPSQPDDPKRILCAAAGCGAKYARDEKLHPSRKSSGPHIHLQIPPDGSGAPNDLGNPKCCGN